MKWTQKNGIEIEISQMSDSHLLNTIKLIEKKSDEGAEVVDVCGYEGDDDFMTGDVYFVKGENYLNRVPEYRELIKEANERNLLK